MVMEWSEGRRGWSEFFWNGAEEDEGGANFPNGAPESRTKKSSNKKSH